MSCKQRHRSKKFSTSYMTFRRWEYQAAVRNAVFEVPEGRISLQDALRTQISSAKNKSSKSEVWQLPKHRSLVSSGSEPHHYFLQVFRCSTLANIDDQSMTCAIFPYVDALRGHVGIIVMISMGSSTFIRDKIAEHSFMHSPLYDLSPTTSLFQRSSSSFQGSTSESGPSGVILFGLISKWDLL